MHRPQQPDLLDIASPPMNRSQSASGDRPQLTSRIPSLLTPPTSTSLAPAYIAASAASQIVTTDHDSQAYSWFTEDGVAPSGETALVSSASLKLVNSFLDQLLYNFLCVARSTSLSALRPAVLEVLKPTLAREAITGADQELNEYLGERDDDEHSETQNEPGSGADWDIERVWKQTRLRCMVYSSLGDVEEDDEDMYLEQEQLNSPVGAFSRPNETGMIPPPVAIFLTSILEFIGEQTLIVAGQAAYQRSRPKKREGDTPVSPSEIADRVVVLELDTEKVALNATLGRLWRTWRKRLRTSTAFPSRALSRDSPFRRHYQPSLTSSSRRSSFDHGNDHAHSGHSHSRNPSLAEVLEEDVAANIALPMSDNDVEEIEVPGLADRDEVPSGSSRAVPNDLRPRHRSLTVAPWRMVGGPSPRASRSDLPEHQEEPELHLEVPLVFVRGRPRSRSLPIPVVTTFESFIEDKDEAAFMTPMQSPHIGAEREGDKETTEDDERAIAGEGKETLPPTSAAHESGFGKEDVYEPERYAAMPADTAKADHARAADRALSGSAAEPVRTVDSHGKSTPSPEPRRRSSTVPSNPDKDTRATPSPSAAPLDSTREPHRAGQSIAAEGATKAIPTVISYSRLRASSDAPRTQRTAPEAQGMPAFERESDTGAIGVARTSNSFVPASTYTSPSGSQRGTPSLDNLRNQPDYPAKSQEDVSVDESHVKRYTAPDSVEPPNRVQIVSTPSPELTKRPLARSPSDEALHTDGVTATDFAHAPHHVTSEPGAPRLTPLRELTEASNGTSDDGSSIGRPYVHGRSEPSQPTDRSLNGRHVIGDAVSAATLAHQRQTSSSSKLSDRYYTTDKGNTASAAERSQAQRLQSPPMTPREPTMPTSRRSNSFGTSHHSHHESDGRAKSPVAHAAHGTSLISRQQDGLERHQSSARSTRSSENRSATSDRPLKPSVRLADKGKTFEQLIKSDETIQYTLTPQTMREIEAPTPEPEDEWGPMPTKTADLADFIRNTGPEEISRSSAARSATGSSRFATSRSNPALSMNQSNTSLRSVQSLRSSTQSHQMGPGGKFIPISTPVPVGSSRSRSGGPVARDARVDRSTTKDIAEFLRSTGPARASLSRDGSVSGAAGAGNVGGQAPPVNANIGAKRNKLLKGTNSGVSSPVRTGSFTSDSSKGRPRLVARDATERQTSRDLIDFIREGPPAGKGPAQMSGAGSRVQQMKSASAANLSRATNDRGSNDIMPSPNVPMGRSGVGSYQAESLPSEPSFDEAPPTTNGTSDGVKGGTKNARFQDDPVAPVRKQRRVRDPYAIDSDDEDEESAAPARPQRTEESLVDFLRNVPPPANSAPAPIQRGPSIDDAAPSPDIARTSPPRKNQSKRNTFLAMGAKIPVASKANSLLQQATSNNSGSSGAPRVASTAPQLQLTNPGRDSPLFNGSGNAVSTGSANGASQKQASKPATGSSPRRPVRSSRGAGVPLKKALEPRTANVTVTNTTSNDLASFLKSSVPPSADAASPSPLRPAASSRTTPSMPTAGADREHRYTGGMRRMFGRGKKTIAA